MRVTDAYIQSRQLLDHFGLFDWQLKCDLAQRRAGYCEHAVKTISLSVHMLRLNEFDEVQKTVRHEIAHALVGPGHGHDVAWQLMALRCGAEPIACYDPDAKKMPAGRWQALCDQCGRLTGKVRQPRTDRIRCRCGKVLQLVDTRPELARAAAERSKAW